MKILFFLMAFVLSSCDGIGGGGVFMPGKPAPSLKTKTLADVNGDMSKLTSYRYPVPGMYSMSFDDALKTKKPIVLEFATPGHCTQCDEQLQMLKVLMKEYGDDVLFLHMDQYYNPEAYDAFRVRGEPWTFVIDGKGIVQTVFPGRTLYQELKPVIKGLLKGDADG